MMTDQEYIRAAVIVADGWYVTHIFAGEDIVAYNPAGKQYPEASFIIQAPTQSGKDTLAAQLVRQVDALEDVFFTQSCDAASIVWIEGRRAAEVGGPDRAMTTLIAIIDSGVLL